MVNPVCPLRAGGDIAGRGSFVCNAAERNESANGATGFKEVAPYRGLHQWTALRTLVQPTTTRLGCGRRTRRAVAIIGSGARAGLETCDK